MAERSFREVEEAYKLIKEADIGENDWRAFMVTEGQTPFGILDEDFRRRLWDSFEELDAVGYFSLLFFTYNIWLSCQGRLSILTYINPEIKEILESFHKGQSEGKSYQEFMRDIWDSLPLYVGVCKKMDKAREKPERKLEKSGDAKREKSDSPMDGESCDGLRLHEALMLMDGEMQRLDSPRLSMEEYVRLEWEVGCYDAMSRVCLKMVVDYLNKKNPREAKRLFFPHVVGIVGLWRVLVKGETAPASYEELYNILRATLVLDASLYEDQPELESFYIRVR